LTITACNSFVWDISKAVIGATLKIATLIATGGGSTALFLTQSAAYVGLVTMVVDTLKAAVLYW